MKKCPFCAESIQDEAAKCRYCGEWLSDAKSAAGLSSKIEQEIEGIIKMRDKILTASGDEIVKREMLLYVWLESLADKTSKTIYALLKKNSTANWKFWKDSSIRSQRMEMYLMLNAVWTSYTALSIATSSQKAEVSYLFHCLRDMRDILLKVQSKFAISKPPYNPIFQKEFVSNLIINIDEKIKSENISIDILLPETNNFFGEVLNATRMAFTSEYIELDNLIKKYWPKNLTFGVDGQYIDEKECLACHNRETTRIIPFYLGVKGGMPKINLLGTAIGITVAALGGLGAIYWSKKYSTVKLRLWLCNECKSHLELENQGESISLICKHPLTKAYYGQGYNYYIPFIWDGQIHKAISF